MLYKEENKKEIEELLVKVQSRSRARTITMGNLEWGIKHIEEVLEYRLPKSY